jgi:proline iminopeptidase
MRDGEYRISVNGVNHWCRVAGGEHGTVPLVVVHGGPGGNVYNFERTIGPLLEQFATVVYYDQRGCGRSDRPSRADEYSIPLLVSDLDALCSSLGLSEIVPLGFSFGGRLAVHYALTHPDRVHTLILQAPTVCDAVRGAYVQLYGFHFVATGHLKRQVEAILHEDGPPQQRLEKVWGLVNSETVDRFLFYNADAAQLNRRLWRESGLVNTGHMRAALAAQPPAPLTIEALGSIKAPTLIIVGLHDRNIGVEACRDLSRTIPGARLAIFEASAHFPDIEEPAKYAAVVRAFLTETGALQHRSGVTA